MFFNSDMDNAFAYGYYTYSVYLNIKNPLEIDCNNSSYDAIRYNGEVKDTYEWAKWAEKNGYDGVIFRNIRDGVDFNSMNEPTNDYVTFASNQIKSATDNIGTFDRRNPDIRYSKSENISKTDEDDDTLYRSDDTIKNRIEALFNQAILGEFKGKSISIGRLTDEGKAYLEHISGIVFKDKVDFVLNPSDLVHINKGHFGNNETDERNIPLDIEDIRSIADVVSFPDRIIYAKENAGEKRKMFFFLKEAENGTYNLLEIYADKKGNLTAKTFYKTKEGVSQRAMTLSKSLHTTSETDGATLYDAAKIPKMFESASVKEENSNREVTEAEQRRMDFTPSL